MIHSSIILAVTPPNRPKHRSTHRPTIKQEHDRWTTHTKGFEMKGQPASQQSNKNMTDRLTQHHGPEALHDGLTGNPAKHVSAGSSGVRPRLPKGRYGHVSTHLDNPTYPVTGPKIRRTHNLL
ncbi:hypothetical protein DY000_02057391 [Brassica cretica]|uniref:Uncharacterized protein n=1 Tax=Brassica cretica TaxID=69181 RepID=A0ABQ7AL55_BRACR|nr:hypothetical protein DY000_02057391 [Brassica cretica]